MIDPYGLNVVDRPFWWRSTRPVILGWMIFLGRGLKNHPLIQLGVVKNAPSQISCFVWREWFDFGPELQPDGDFRVVEIVTILTV